MKEKFNLKGIWEIKTVDKKLQKVLQKEIVENLIVNTGLERLAKLLNGVSSVYINTIAIGTGDTAPDKTDIELEDENQREEATLAYEEDYKAKFTYTFSFSEETTITEAGLFDSDIVEGSIMFNRVVFSGKECNETIDLIVTAKITVA